MHALCALQVVHCDLKAKNILLSRDRSLAKIGDVGLARTMFETHLSTASGFFGTFSYAAPEVLLRTRCNEKVSHSASLWGPACERPSWNIVDSAPQVVLHCILKLPLTQRPSVADCTLH